MRESSPPSPASDPAIVLLQALAWVCADEARADRLLALTGLDVETLRAQAGDPAVLSALADYLGGHEPDLIACADALGIAPTALMHAGAALSGTAS